MSLLTLGLTLLRLSAADAKSDSSPKCLSHHGLEHILSDSRALSRNWEALAATLSSFGSSQPALVGASHLLDTIDSQITYVKANLTDVTCVTSGGSRLVNSTRGLLLTVRTNLDQYFQPMSVSKLDYALADIEHPSNNEFTAFMDTDISRKSGGHDENSGRGNSDDTYSNGDYKYKGHVTGDDTESSSSRESSRYAHHSAINEPAYGQPQYQQPPYQQPPYQQPPYQQPPYQQPPYQQPPYRPANEPPYGQSGSQPYGQGYGSGYAQPAYGQYGSDQRSGGFPERIVRFTEQLIDTLFHQLEEIGSIFVIVGGQSSMGLVQDTERQVRELAGRLHLI